MASSLTRRAALRVVGRVPVRGILNAMYRVTISKHDPASACHGVTSLRAIPLTWRSGSGSRSCHWHRDSLAVSGPPSLSPSPLPLAVAAT